MPLYNSASTAAALGLDAKWLDNFLSHNKIDGVHSARQGVPRRLSNAAVELVALSHTLVHAARIPTTHAITIAQALLADPDTTVALTPVLTLSLDINAFKRKIEDRLALAVDVTPTPRRGRHRPQ